MRTPTYGLVGRGRAASHLGRYLEIEGRRVVGWHRGAAADLDPEAALAAADVVILAISDDALSAFLAAHPSLAGRSTVHLSGSLSIDGAVGLHPLMTFGPEPYELATYRKIPFVGERGGAGFTDLFPGLSNPSWTIAPELKPLYHALCVLAGNFSTLLWAKAMDGFESRLGLPREALRPFLERTAVNTLEHRAAALTGSLARGDEGTVRRDLAALTGDPYHEVYLALAHAFRAEEVRS
jgi:predicted short-subunit dehydrogenase-like oxidoreductase (DUF2520 family)